MEQIRQEQLMEWSSEGESEGTLRKNSLGVLFVSSMCERTRTYLHFHFFSIVSNGTKVEARVEGSVWQVFCYICVQPWIEVKCLVHFCISSRLT